MESDTDGGHEAGHHDSSLARVVPPPTVLPLDLENQLVGAPSLGDVVPQMMQLGGLLGVQQNVVAGGALPPVNTSGAGGNLASPAARGVAEGVEERDIFLPVGSHTAAPGCSSAHPWAAQVVDAAKKVQCSPACSIVVPSPVSSGRVSFADAREGDSPPGLVQGTGQGNFTGGQ